MNSTSNNINNESDNLLDKFDHEKGILMGKNTGGCRHKAQKKFRKIVDKVYQEYISSKVDLDEDKFILNENESTYIPPETKHRLENAGDNILEIIEVQSGSYLGEDDIVRHDDDFGR